MVVLGRIGMQKARRKQARFSEQNKRGKEEEKPISEEEHKKRLEVLKQLGLIKEIKNE